MAETGHDAGGADCRPPVSFELFPPRTDAAALALRRTIDRLAEARSRVHLGDVRRGRHPRAALARRCSATCSRTPTSSRWRTSPASARRTPRRTASSASSSTRASRASSRCAATRRPGSRSPTRASATSAAPAELVQLIHRVQEEREPFAQERHPRLPRRRAGSASGRDPSAIAVAAFPNGHPRSAVALRRTSTPCSRRRSPARTSRSRSCSSHADDYLGFVERARAAGVDDPHPARHHAGDHARAPRPHPRADRRRAARPNSRSTSRSSPIPRPRPSSASPTRRALARRACSTAAHPASTSTPSTAMRPCSTCSTRRRPRHPPTDSSIEQEHHRTMTAHRLPHRHDPRLPAHRAPPRAQARRRGLLGRHDRRRRARGARRRAARGDARAPRVARPRPHRLVDPRVVLVLRPGARRRGRRRRRARALRRPRRTTTARVDLAGYFTIARGEGDDAPLEMTKWFDSNYHYLVPEIGPDTAFALRARPHRRASSRRRRRPAS